MSCSEKKYTKIEDDVNMEAVKKIEVEKKVKKKTL